ncbi:choline BCCT transporter BetT [Ectothiorhodospiraceae bacterium 2226]|nr:choline BCCT transporter BetT [Ectothiorhodospiraceae bacterium 2226]
MSNGDSDPQHDTRRGAINPPVFYSAVLLVVVLVAFAMLAPERAEVLFESVQSGINETMGWFYLLAVGIFLGFVIVLAASGYGRIKLGPDHSEPEFSYRSWFAMLFSAGMGIGLMFFSVAEPILHYATPPVGEGRTVDAAREAMRITFFHWGLHAWAIYAVVALVLAYFAFRHNLPLAIRSALYPLIGERIHGPIGHAVDVFAILGTLFGVATSLGLGSMQINAGLNYLFGVPSTVAVQLLLIALITGLALISLLAGLHKGIRRLSELNLILAVVLLVFVLAVGPTVFLLHTLVQNTGGYLSEIVYKTFNLYVYQPGEDWIGGWTLFYWGWWIAWSPFVGMFIARISRGRTIREFVLGVLLVPVGFTFLWLTVFGDTAIHFVLRQGVEGLIDAVQADEAVALFQMLQNLPLAAVTSLIATLLVITFFVTSSDSGSLVIDIIASGGRRNRRQWTRVFWAVSEGVVAGVLLLVGGLTALQTAAIASALPFSIVMLIAAYGLYAALRLEMLKRGTLQQHVSSARHTREPHSWRERVRRIVTFPGEREVRRFLQETARPALTSVAEELRKAGLDVAVRTEPDREQLEVHLGGGGDFVYGVRLHGYAPPAFILDQLDDAAEEHRYFRAEVFLKEGSHNFDIYGYSRDEVIGDVLDQYERHMYFLHMAR